MEHCKHCNVRLTNENWYSSAKSKNYYICIKCFNDYQNIKSKIYREQNKLDAINICGGQCVCCGENNINFLTIDHIDGTGKKDRKNGINSTILHKLLVNKKYDNINNLRSLCYNCNCALGTYGYCPHNINVTENCFSCNEPLITRDIGKAKKFQNYHPFFKNSNINICFDCAFKNKNTITITREQRENRLAKLNRRTNVIEGYGKKCECCNESRYIFLTIDHINNHDDNLAGQALYRYLIKNNFPKDNYRLLCYNCNCGRGHNGSDGICPHKKENIETNILASMYVKRTKY